MASSTSNVVTFPESLKALEEVFKLLACTACGKTPTGKVFNLGNCIHKYCKTCVQDCLEKGCRFCKTVENKEYIEDTFSTNLVTALLSLSKEFNEEKKIDEIGGDVEGENEKEPMMDIMDKEGPHGRIEIKPNDKQVQEITEQNQVEVIQEGLEHVEESQPPALLVEPIMELDEPKIIVENMLGKVGNVDLIDIPVLERQQIQNDLVLERGQVVQPRPSRQKRLEKDNDQSVGVQTRGKAVPEKKPKLSHRKTSTRARTLHCPSKDNLGQERDTISEVAHNVQPSHIPVLKISIPISENITPFRQTTPRILARGSNRTPRNAQNLQGTNNSSRKSSTSAKGIAVSSSVSSQIENSLASVSFTSGGGGVDKRNAKGETPLHVACRSGMLEKVKRLLLMGADPSVQDNAGWTPLHEAINGKASDVIKYEMVKLLFEEGHPSCNPNIVGFNDETALHEAARGDLQDILKYLLDKHASPYIRNKEGKLPREVAASQESVKILEDATLSSILNSPDAALVDDPVVLDLQMSKAVLFFNYQTIPSVFSKAEELLKLNISKAKDIRNAKDVTHIIFRTVNEKDKLITFSLEYLYGLVTGTWILSSDWIDKSLSSLKILSPSAFEINGCCDVGIVSGAPKLARINKEHGRPGLLDGFCFYIYKNSACEKISKKDLIKLIQLAGGQVINREPNPNMVDPLEYPTRFHVKGSESESKLILTSHIILYDAKNKPPQAKMHNLEHMKTLKTEWLFDSIVNFGPKDPTNYL